MHIKTNTDTLNMISIATPEIFRIAIVTDKVIQNDMVLI